MAATVMTIGFGTIHHYSSLEENSETFVQFFEQIQQLTEQYVNYDRLVSNKHVLNSNMNTN